MGNRKKIEELRRLLNHAVANSRAARSTVELREPLLPRMPTLEDRAILHRLPIVMQATYQSSDQWDHALTLARLKTCGSIVESVGIDVASELLRERTGVPA